LEAQLVKLAEFDQLFKTQLELESIFYVFEPNLAAPNSIRLSLNIVLRVLLIKLNILGHWAGVMFGEYDI
jgi:hypothetical protein